MDNANVHDEGFDIDSYLDKWNEENAGDDTDEVEEPTQTEETENAAAGTAEESSEEGTTSDAEEESANDDAQNTGDADDDKKLDDAEGNGANTEETTGTPTGDEKPASKNNTELYKERFDAALAQIQREFPDVQSVSDIGDIRTFAILTTVGRLSALEAYKTIKNTAASDVTAPPLENATNDEIAAAEARGAQKAAGKSHLRSTVPKGVGEDESLTDSETEEYAEMLGISASEVKKLHKRINKQKG